MRILAIDFGRKRVGLAMTDPSGTVASPVAAIERKGKEWWDRLTDFIREQQVVEIVVGLPKNMDGSLGPAAEICTKFASDLEGRCGIRPVLLDERLSSQAASMSMREAGVREKEQRGKLDSVAASLLLQVYLSRRSQ